jgi:hypothetical protein
MGRHAQFVEPEDTALQLRVRTPLMYLPSVLLVIRLTLRL